MMIKRRSKLLAAALLYFALASPAHSSGLPDDLRQQLKDYYKRAPAEAVK